MRIHEDSRDFGRGFARTLEEDSQGFVRIHKRICETL